MKVQVIRPNIEKYRIRMERGDKDYTRCMWADILIDHDAYAITAQTDCGDYSYRWTATPGEESFRELCLRMLGDEVVNEYPQSAFTFVHLLKTIVLPTMRGATKA